MKRLKKVWITWEHQRRNITMSRCVDAKLFEFDLKHRGLPRYFTAVYLTWLSFIKERPDLIFVQNPSLVLAVFAVSYGKVLKIPVIVDAHNAGLLPSGGGKLANRIALYIMKTATLTIVTNESLKGFVEQNGGRGFVFPDPIPDFKYMAERKALRGKYNILFVCSYATDEPYLEVIKAAKELGPDVCIYITGNYVGKEGEFGGILQEYTVITGYLPDDEYIRLLYSVDLVIDLTSREDCLVCGGYEAVAAEKPLILSDTMASRTCFSKGTLYVDNTADDLISKINAAMNNLPSLRSQIKDLRQEKIKEEGERKEALEEVLTRIIHEAYGDTPSRNA